HLDFPSRIEGREIESVQTVFEAMEIKDVASWTNLLNGYMKCNDLVSARRLFDEMPSMNAIFWSAIDGK
ncbi:hypothetical protein U1Q18_001207, partial [Sarracenia purpurea var. burkii]